LPSTVQQSLWLPLLSGRPQTPEQSMALNSEHSSRAGAPGPTCRGSQGGPNLLGLVVLCLGKLVLVRLSPRGRATATGDGFVVGVREGAKRHAGSVVQLHLDTGTAAAPSPGPRVAGLLPFRLTPSKGGKKGRKERPSCPRLPPIQSNRSLDQSTSPCVALCLSRPNQAIMT